MKQVTLEKTKEKNDILIKNNFDDKNTTKIHSNKNIGNINQYNKIVNEMDENINEDLKIKEESPLMKKKNESLQSEDMELDGRYLTDPLRSNPMINKIFPKSKINIFYIKNFNIFNIKI
jgi:hypothetical protein